MLRGVIREFAKLIMFLALWTFPMYLARVTGHYEYLFFFIVSLLGTLMLFTHYEDLEKIDIYTQFTGDEDTKTTSESE